LPVGVQFSLGEHAVGGRQQIVEQDEGAPVDVQLDVAAGRYYGTGHHHGHRRLDEPVGCDAQQVVFARHGNRYGQAPEHGKRGQAQLLGAGQAQFHVAQMDERHRKYVRERAPADVREPREAQPLGRVQHGDRGEHLADGQEPVRGEPVTGQHGLVDDCDQRRRGRVQQRRAGFGKSRRPCLHNYFGRRIHACVFLRCGAEVRVSRQLPLHFYHILQ